MVTGGFAAIVYGHPRLTLDLDLILQLRPADASRFTGLWPADQFYCPPAEVVAAESQRAEHGHFNVIHTATSMRADIYLVGDNELQRWALDRTVMHRIMDEDVRIAPIEYVIAYKLIYARQGGSDRHLRDVARMLEIRGGALDAEALGHWVTRLDLEAELARARAMVGKAL